MAIKRIESFDHWVTADAAKKGWTLAATSVVSAGNGRNSTASLRTTNPQGLPGAGLSVTNTGRTGVAGFAFRCAALPASDTGLIAVMEGATLHIVLVLLATGALRLYRSSTGGTILATSGTTPITGATYHYIEVAWTLHDTTGTYDVRVNGAAVAGLSGSGADTQQGGTGIWNGLRWWGNSGASSATWDIDDVYVADDLTFRGDHRIVSLLPSTGNGTNVAWTPSTGTDHGALVDEAAPNITDYVSTSSAGAIDTYNFPAVGVAGTVAGVQTSIYSKAEVAGVRTLVPAFRIGGADQVGTGAVLGSDWAYLTEFAAVSPATAVAWTVAEIDAAEFGVKVTV